MRPPRAQVEADLFQRGWSRIAGRVGSGTGVDSRASRAIRSATQMVGAACGGSPAVFKVIRDGGCRSPAQLRSQLAYVGTKAAAVFDSRGLLDGRRSLGPREIEEAARRLAADWRPGPQLRLGHTAHLLMSFPIGTPPRIAGAVAEAVCAGAFQRPGATFDYVAALHTDRAHPHVHVIVNRHGIEGGLLTLRPDSPHSYQAFREAMVEHAARHGLLLEATRRLDRGKLTYAARDPEVRRARDRGRTTAERPRAGRDLAAAIQEVAGARRTYQGLGVQASQSGFTALGVDLGRAAETLARGEVVRPQSATASDESRQGFVRQLKSVGSTVQLIEGRIAAEPAERPRLQRGLRAILATLPYLPSLHGTPTADSPNAIGVGTAVGPVGGQPRHPSRPDLLAAVADRMRRADPAGPTFSSVAESHAFRREVERRLRPDEVSRLARGDPDALTGVADRSIDRLTLAKAYLEGRGGIETSAALRSLTLGIARAQLALKRERLGHDRGGDVHD